MEMVINVASILSYWKPASLYLTDVTRQARPCRDTRSLNRLDCCKWTNNIVDEVDLCLCQITTTEWEMFHTNTAQQTTWQVQTPHDQRSCRTPCSTFRWIRLPGSTGALQEEGYPWPWSPTDRSRYPSETPASKERNKHFSVLQDKDTATLIKICHKIVLTCTHTDQPQH